MGPTGQPPRSTPTMDEALTAQFYEWEMRGRGWRLCDFPIPLEPPFRPFFGHFLPRQPVYDEARRPTFFGSIASALRGEIPQQGPPPEPAFDESMYELEAEPFDYSAPLIEIEVEIPNEAKVTCERASQLLCLLASGHDPVSFELVARGGIVTLQFVCAAPQKSHLCGQVRAYCPDAMLREHDTFLSDQWRSAPPTTVLIDFGLSREFMLPLGVPREYDLDPLFALAAALKGVDADDLGVFQVIVHAARQPWSQSIMRSVTDANGRSFFADAPDMAARAEKKIGKPLLAVAIRVAARAKNQTRAWQIARNVGSVLGRFADPVGNELMPLTNEGYDDADHARHFLARLTCRTGMLLNADEAASIVHLPSQPP